MLELHAFFSTYVKKCDDASTEDKLRLKMITDYDTMRVTIA